MRSGAASLPRRRLVVLLLGAGAGASLAATLPPLGWWPLGPLGVALLAVALRGLPVGWRLWCGTAAGLGLFVPGLVWIARFSLPGYLLATALQAAFLAAAAALVPPGRGRLLPLPAALVLAEAARGRWPLGGLPLAGPALGQLDGPFAPAARLLGGLGLVALPALVGTAVSTGGLPLGVASLPGAPALASLLGLPDPQTGARSRRQALGAMAALATAAGVVGLATLTPAGPPTGRLAVAAVQGGGQRGIPAVVADPGAVLARQLDASRRLRPPVDLVLWPEDVVDVAGQVAGSAEEAQLRALARRVGATLVAGVVEDAGPGRFRNAAVAWGPRGERLGRYDKVRLVPFGEVVPARGLVARLTDLSLIPRDAVAGRGPGVLATPAGRLGVLVSYEVFFSDRARAAVRAGATVLLVPTNAASFTTAQVPALEVAAARLRAIETGRAVVQAAPTGSSALIDPSGRVVAQSALEEPAVVQGSVETRSGRTPYVRAGDGPLLAAAAVALALAWTQAWRRGGTRVWRA